MADDWDRTLDEEVPRLVELLHGLGLEEIAVEQDGRSVRIRRSSEGFPGEQHEQAIGEVSPAESSGDGYTVLAEHVGVFRRASADSTKSVVTDGDSIVAGQAIAYVDVLGVFHAVVSTSAGLVGRFFVTDGQPVEVNQPLVGIVLVANGNPE